MELSTIGSDPSRICGQSCNHNRLTYCISDQSASPAVAYGSWAEDGAVQHNT